MKTSNMRPRMETTAYSAPFVVWGVIISQSVLKTHRCKKNELWKCETCRDQIQN